jgi:5-hydroxyisourate hydrolase
MAHPTLSTHVLDVSAGAPAEGVKVELFIDATLVHSGRTDAEGRIPRLGDRLEPGAYRLVFELGDHFAGRDHLFERVALDIRLAEARHHHVPLLVTAFSCSTYRGS